MPFFGPGLGFGALLVFGAVGGAGVSFSGEGALEAALRARPSILILSAISIAVGVPSRELVASFGGCGVCATGALGVVVDRVDAPVFELVVALVFVLLVVALSRFSFSIWRASVYVSPLSRFALDTTAFF